ncbi:WEE/WEE-UNCLASSIFIED protein kinase [Capronia epimyces CBS 606.96]|uniref:WEE/WEE-UNCLASSIFIED protein kinase n=1 Tax=Capronia epimyces CBS 606.96 TaxID=1182542 RepID=W9Y655_9EURO|nr:WEE/WEE-UNCLASSIFIED protein kinase [Capronia epimyces CBS 606.96]EXJ77889.1 WEE/WEE-UNCLASSIFIED protein kinase [Capronia epimyces CBS 606.96]
MATYSPHREDGEAVHLHSPKGIPHFDPQSAIREIRRSLSRSPSKGSELRQYPFRSPSSGNLPFSPSPLSPSRKSTSESLLHISNMVSPHSNRGPQGPRFQRPILRRTAQPHGITRIRTSPKSPSKRVLADSSDSGNSSPMPLRKRSSGEAEREVALKALTTGDSKENDRSPEGKFGRKAAQTRQEKRRSGGALITAVAPLSPMKRCDGPAMDGAPGLESPSAKRRSLHGPGLDFSIFESDSLDGGMFNDKRSQDDSDWFASTTPLPSSRFSTIPKRSSSLRKSTLQQRQLERPSNLKFNQIMDWDQSWVEATPVTSSKKGLRLSLDNHLQPLPRDSPFSSQGSLLSASIHPIGSSQNSFSQQQPRHPLSRTLTQSSSQPSEQDDSPTHEPAHRPNRPRSHDFSKSLPIGASRPVPSPEQNEQSSQGSFATPGNYKAAKPLPAAFMSTGLISKKNRNVEDPNAGLPKAHMPDTPCKKQPMIFPTDSNAVANRAHRQSFGAAVTPLEAHHGPSKISAFPFAKSVGIFGTRSSKHNLLREGSFAPIGGEDKISSRSPLSRANSQSTESDYPPTPTKHITDSTSRGSVSPSPNTSRLAVNQGPPSSAYGTGVASSKLSPILASPGRVDGDSDSVMEDSPSASLRPKSTPNAVSIQGSSFTQGRLSKNLGFPTPLSRKTLSVQILQSPALERAKMSSISPVSPRLDRFDRASPHTPLESFFPPDPSGLSISGRAERPATRHEHGPASIIPATPTAPREYFSNFSNRPSLNLASAEASNVDSSLTSRFEKVDLIGSGEFSQVYRVSQPPEVSPYHKIYSVSTSRPSSRGSMPEKVWAVKRSRYPYTGARDRQRKIHEVDVLKALGHSDHIVTFVDSWEEQGHLYIQTEFCEEGTLDVFLAQVGLKARLDDFRIWKILLELTMGLKHIHDSGFIHLDLKPANVLITFEGVLKIADFGMATRWPAKAGIEGEGDREYIGPEVLMGRYDKPADIFALGLIMLETAGNVELPDNGVSWQKLRNGDMSDVPSLTWSSGTSSILRDSSGNPIAMELPFDPDQEYYQQDVEVVESEQDDAMAAPDDRKPLHHPRSGELVTPPQFMVDPSHEQALDRVVRWMISPNPNDRPLASDVLSTEGVRWAEARRRAGATVFEGNWGPADEVLAEDAEMIDV